MNRFELITEVMQKAKKNDYVSEGFKNEDDFLDKISRMNDKEYEPIAKLFSLRLSLDQDFKLEDDGINIF